MYIRDEGGIGIGTGDRRRLENPIMTMAIDRTVSKVVDRNHSTAIAPRKRRARKHAGENNYDDDGQSISQ